MSGSNPQGFPLLSSPVIDNQGRMTQPWIRFFITLWQRTGGGSGSIPGPDFDTYDVLSSDDAVPSSDEILAVVGDDQTSFPGSLSTLEAMEGEPPSQMDQLLTLVLGCDGACQDPGLALTDDNLPESVASTALVSVTVGASPFSFQAYERSVVLVIGGTLTDLEFSRDGTTFYSIGTGSRIVPLATGDILRTTYAVAPTMQVGSI